MARTIERKELKMPNQIVFSKKSVAVIRDALALSGGPSRYLADEPFRPEEFETLESPTIEAPQHLVDRVDPKSDVETAIALFESYPNLNPLEASSVGFWTYLTHVDLWAYMKSRFKLDGLEGKSLVAKIKDKWLLDDPSQSKLIHHPLAGLWWGVKLSADPDRGEGKYDLTRVLFRDLDLLTRTLGTYELGRLPMAIKGILGYVHDHPDDFKNDYEAKTRYIMKYFNSMGGVLQLGCLDDSFYREKLDESKDLWIKATRSSKATA